MRYFVILCSVAMLSACGVIKGPETATLRNPTTGDIVTCGPSETLLEETQCLNKYESQGYYRYDGPKDGGDVEIISPGGGSLSIRKAD